MKTTYIRHLLSQDQDGDIILNGWLSFRRDLGKIVFLDITDSTGTMPAVADGLYLSTQLMEEIRHTPLESAIEVRGRIVINKSEMKEILLSSFSVISKNLLQLLPRPRSNFDIFDPSHLGQIMEYRHIYLRNSKVMAILRFRSNICKILRQWFDDNQFMEFDAPLLTPGTLYDDDVAIPIVVHDEKVYLNQCAGFYIEAGVHAFERVFSMSPAFRGEESRSKRHLLEFWQVKAEVAFGNREDIIRLVEDMLGYVTRQCALQCSDEFDVLETQLCVDGLRSPFPRITYEKAVDVLQRNGCEISFGQSISASEEESLSKFFNSPFWIMGMPRTVEPFPYAIDPADSRITVTADLVANRGFGELLGVAEKIYDLKMLDERLQEKGKLGDPRYQFIREIHQAGCVPHIAFGMGLERLIRWLLGLSHVRETIPFPRVLRRRIYP